MALTPNQLHRTPCIRPKNRENSTCQQNNGRLPQSCEDTPECLTVKLIMSSLGWLASLRELLITTRDHETAHGIPILWFGMKCGEVESRYVGHGSFETPNISMLLKRKTLLRVQMDKIEVRFVLWGVNRNSHWGSAAYWSISLTTNSDEMC